MNRHEAYLPFSPERRERGAIMVLMALLAAVLFALLGIVMTIGYRSMVRSELQEAVDSTALAAAAALCAQRACFENVRTVALDNIGRHVIHGNFGDTAKVNLDDNGGPGWSVGNIRVRIERGRWWGDKLPTGVGAHLNQPFEPYDITTGAWLPDDLKTGRNDPYGTGAGMGTVEWQSQHLGIPGFMTANAVYVRMDRPKVPILFNLFGLNDYQLRAEAYAVAGEDGEVVPAPFAVPVCALVKKVGVNAGLPVYEYDPAEQCKGDRLFTEATRYCPNMNDCTVLPGFAYSPNMTEPETLTSSASIYPADSHRQDNPWFMQNCSGAKPYDLDRVYKQYGVVGLPTDYLNGVIDESQVQTVLTGLMSGGQPYFVHLGDEFSVLADGLTSSWSEIKVWNLIQPLAFKPTNNGGVLAGGHYGDEPHTSLFTHGKYDDSMVVGAPAMDVNRRLYWSVNPVNPSFSLELKGIQYHALKPALSSGTSACLPGEPPAYGICKSRLMEFKGNTGTGCNIAMSPPGWFSGSPTAVANNLISGVLGMCNWQYTTDAVLQVTGPVTDNYRQEELLNTVWRAPISVIGDVNAGSLSCDGDDFFVNSAQTGSDWRVLGFIDAVFFDTDIGNGAIDVTGLTVAGLRHMAPGTDPALNTLKLAFTSPRTGGADSCYLVRARIPCEQKFVPSTDYEHFDKVRLVATTSAES